VPHRPAADQWLLPEVRADAVPSHARRHEIAGEVDKIGSLVPKSSGLAEGDQVVVVGGWGDGTCRYCQSGDTQICEHGRWPGFGPYGGYSEFVPVPVKYIIKVNGGGSLKPEELAPLTDAGLTPYRGIKKLRDVGALGPSRVLVLGPDSSLVALILGVVLPLSAGDPQRAVALAGMLALVSGALDDAAVEAYLESLPGVGPKTAACVLLFAMGRAAFPIDTHVHRIATRLGWIPANTTAEKAHRLLAPRVPPDIRYDLHVAMVAHGRTFCRAQRPRCDVCVLRDLCAYGSGGRVAGWELDGRPAGR